MIALGALRGSAYACVVAQTEDAEDALAWAGRLVAEELAVGADAMDRPSLDVVREELFMLCEVASILAEACKRYGGDDRALAAASRNLEVDLGLAREVLRSIETVGTAIHSSGIVRVGDELPEVRERAG